MVRKQRNASESEPTKRKRGRPSGRNRVPLSLEERRARNAQYERERRNEKSEAMAQLAEAAGVDPSMATTDLLATVLNRIQRAAEINATDDVEKLKRINGNLMSQIEKLENELMLLCPEFDGTNIDDLSEQCEAAADVQSQDYSSSEGSSRTKKITGKRKRKSNKRKESDSDYVSGFQSESSSEYPLAKRSKIEMETHETQNEIISQRITRSSHTSPSSYDMAFDGVTETNAPTFDQTSSHEQSNFSYQTVQQEVENPQSTEENQWLSSDVNIDLELPQLPVGFLSLSNADYLLPDLTVQEPQVEYSPEFISTPVTTAEDQVVESQVEIPLNYGLQPDDNFVIPPSQEIQLMNDSDWFDANFFMNADNFTDNLVFS